MPHTGGPGQLSRAIRASWRRVAAPGAVALAAGIALVAGAGPAAAAPLRAGRPAAPVLRFSPAPYDYGPVSEGQAATRTFTLANSGRKATGRLRVRLSAPAAFTISSDHCGGTHLRPGGRCTITVRFAPASAGQQTATLTAASQGHHASASDALTGTGTSLGLAPAQIYWTSGNAIWAANLDGSSPHAIVTSSTDPEGVAVDTSHLYWADGAAGTINEASLDGTGPHSIVTGRQLPLGMAVSGSHIYWSDQGDQADRAGSIWEAGLDGSDPHAVVTGQSLPTAVAVGVGHLYWADDGNDAAGDGTIWEAGLDGSSPHTILTGQTLGDGVAADTSQLYLSSLDDAVGNATIDEAGLDGTDLHPIVTGLDQPAGVASNASNIYWADAHDGTINEADPDGTSPHPIVTGQTAPTWVAVTPAAPQLAFVPAPFSYGRVSTGQAAAQEFTLFNSGEAATGPLAVTVSGSAEFTITSDTCTSTSLGPGQRCLVTVRFTPASAAPATATLIAASQEPTASATDALSGTGVGTG